MNKTLLTIAIVGLLTLFTSAYYSAPADSRIGYKAPSLFLGDDNNGLAPLQQHRGETILLTFWSSANADSRIDNMRYDRLSRGEGSKFTHVSVNLDRSASVFNTIVAIDNLDRSAQLHSALDMQADIIKAWRLEDSFHSFLIDPNGVIIAIDPDADDFSKLN